MIISVKLFGSTVSYKQKLVVSSKFLKVFNPKVEKNKKQKREYSTQASFLDSTPSNLNLDNGSLSP